MDWIRRLLTTSSALAFFAAAGGTAGAGDGDAPEAAPSDAASPAIRNSGHIDAIRLREGAVVQGGIVNTGTISTPEGAPDHTAISIRGATVQGGITNSGLISATGKGRAVGIAITGGNIAGGIVNTGTISAVSGPSDRR